jgi:tRNA threonylcarbamoyladenosine biosynthesis protein TsaB
VAELLGRVGLDVQDLAGVAVAIGPGSYTGLRIGLAFAKGLTLATQIRLIGVPTLDIMAAAQPWYDGQLIVIAEAGRTRICAGTYQWQAGKGWLSNSQPVIQSWETLLAGLENRTTIAGEITPTSAKLVRASGRQIKIVQPADSVRRSGYLAEIGWKRLRRGWIDDPSSLAPIYLHDPAGASKQGS